MKIKHLIVASLISIQSAGAWAQDISPSKMERDLKIAEDVVSSLIKGESDDGRFYSASPQASYIPGFGVMIDINSTGKFYSNHFDSDFNFEFTFNNQDFKIDVGDLAELEMQAELLARQAEEIERQSERMARENERMAREHQQNLEQRERELEREREKLEQKHEKAHERHEEERHQHEAEAVENYDDEYTYRYSYNHTDTRGNEEERNRYVSRSYQKDFNDLKPIYKNVMTTFLLEYADLIGQLEDREQIMLVVKSEPQAFTSIPFGGADESAKFSAAVTRKQIADYKTGKISQAAFKSSIYYVETKGSDKKAADLELFASILQRLYKTDLATTYYTSTPILYEQLKNFGVIYKMQMYSSNPVSRDYYSMPTLKEGHLSREERDLKVKEMYPKFINELKQNILDYGKTIKSLQPNESILFQIRMSECNSCDLPEEINVLVKNQILQDLDAGKINESKALEQIKVKEVR
ncbi:hypothetical protein N7E81_15525 [Reichenbachiella carrageenanivorans]|uniref:Uncharacterized protein n=1 Tax=Reichenbachiella carrageenanivorans TaxID=2979869 RepID=A0ABY6D119_9BACT|nr:hypothetical protein [Reichenbachiella carrageenanivorans]UXX78768.1 hypothetical protein N7E81_15525 [Reichenbachiella carrageenanivorans]